MIATIKLFKALPIQDRKKDDRYEGMSLTFSSFYGSKEPRRSLLEATIQRGFIFSPEVVLNYSEQELLEIVKDIGRTSEQLNSSFHKSWRKVKEADIVQLVLEQMLHYITTYGFEELGVYNKDSVYIPNEQLDVPDVKIDSMNLVVIKGYTKEELREKVLKMLSSGVALKKETLNCMVKLCTFVGVSLEDLKRVKNKEVRIKLYEYLDILPEDPFEFLRFLLYRTINETLLIKNRETIEKIVESDKFPVLCLFTKYGDRYGLRNLAKIFNRFKSLFLAFKSDRQINSIINKISKLSKIYHEPMRVDYLNEITSMIKKGEPISPDRLKYELGNVNTFRKIRLAYALKYRTKDVGSILYRVRNGKSWATGVNYDEYMRIRSDNLLKIVLRCIVDDINKRVCYKKIYLPTNVEYTLPATEKQFTGNFPSGTHLTVDQDMMFGIHWFNHKSERVDLDLSLISAEGEKFGWDGAYRSDTRSILFSGDVTDAPRPKGASELFYLKSGLLECPGILMVNYYNYSPQEVPFEIIVGKCRPRIFDENYTVNPNDIICSTESKIDSEQKILGIIVPTAGGPQFYFSETNIGRRITSSGSPGVEAAKQYLIDFYTDTISLNQILRQSDAKIVSDEKDCDISLSPEKIEKDTILNLLS